jgi:hypothetical protein
MSVEQELLPTPETIAKYVKQNAAKAKKSSAMMAMHHEGGQEIVRQDDYKGHHIVVRTVYHITIDGQEVTGHIMLTNDGQVQYHGLPNRSFDSTVQLARTLIDNFPEDFEKASKASDTPRSMAGMKMGGATKGSSMAGMHMRGEGKGTPKASGKSPKMAPKQRSRSKSRRPKAKHKSK